MKIMKKIAVIIASILLGGMVICLIVFKGFTDNSIYSDMGVSDSYDGFEIEKRSEEHTSELQSLSHLVCRLLLEKKKYKS